MYAFGGSWGNGKTINSPQNVQALQFLVDLFVSNKAAATAKQLGAGGDGEAFAKGNVAFSTGGPWYIGYMQQAGPNVHYQLMPIPTSNGGTAMVTYGGGLSIFANVQMPAVVDTIQLKVWDLDYYMTCVYQRHRTKEELEKLLGQAPLPIGEVYLSQDPPRMYKAVQQTKRICLAFKILAAGQLSDCREWV